MSGDTKGLIDIDKLKPLGKKIFEAKDEILERWASLARAEISEAQRLPDPILINTLPLFLARLAESIGSRNERRTSRDVSTTSQEHGGERARLTRYGVDHIVREYQFLRFTIFDHLAHHQIPLSISETKDIDIFIDDAIGEAVVGFSLVQADIRERFVATLSHDLRSPLVAAHMAAQMLARKPTGPDVKETAHRIVMNLKRMDRMVRDLLDATQVRAGGRITLDIEACDMLDVVNETVSHAAMIHGERFIVKGESCRGSWGRDALERAIDNLLGNAIKYGDSTQPVAVAIHSEHGRVMVSVHNEGNPIEATDHDVIFQSYRRTDSAKRGKHRGWGLGLALVRGVAESHGGSVVLESSPDRGTTFTVDIPIDATPFQERPVTRDGA